MSARGRRLKVAPKREETPGPALAEQAEKLVDLVEESGAFFEALAEVQAAYVEAVDDLVQLKTGKTLWGKDGLAGGDAAAYRCVNARDMAIRVLRENIEGRIEAAHVKAVELRERIKGATAGADTRLKRKAVA